MDADLQALADAHGVATSYRDGQRRRVDVDAEVVREVLGLLGVDASRPEPAQPHLPGTVVHRPGRPLPAGATLADGPDISPDELTPGYYQLVAGDERATLVVPPPALPDPAATWGWMLQLYALRSQRSWGIGDLGDLREFTRWTAEEHGAGAVLVNPLHAVTPVHPVQPSPYTPSSRRFVNPLYLRIADIEGYDRIEAEVDALRPPNGDQIDYDAVWEAKRAALELLWRAAGSPAVAPTDFATFCALAEQHGPRWPRWPQVQRHPSTAGADPRRVAFHAWVQQQCAAQLTAARAAAREMAIGVLHDLAVGVDPEGADAWALQDVLATGVTVGAPPDAFNRRGQDWGLPPWRPDRLAATGYAAYRQMLRAVLAHADGVRIDHVAGLWRLWWIPPGSAPDRGTYVRYDAEAMLAVLAVEAHRAGAVVIGEDLGTVEPKVTEALAARRALGCAVLWFARDEDAPGQPMLPPARWPEWAAASISTHDLPTAAGFLRGEHVRVRAELGLLGDDPGDGPGGATAVAAEQRRADAERAELLELLRAEGLLAGGEDQDEDAVVVAMHALLARSPCRLRLVSPYDLVGEVRQPNLPGTVDEYPNWRLPLPLTLEQLRTAPLVARMVSAMRAAGTRAEQ
ncbi:MAG TPA: 4-alpha-glucanotransferase [Pseudonocardiaceae bacterium]|jgi:4-alpha-glucanotransferase|nr:4-alpha-glucanotransferase [Pseudonocardiaceae bacterium]